MRRDAASARAGSSAAGRGGGGQVYLRQLDGSGAKLADERIVDNAAHATNASALLITAGTGTVTAVNGNVVTLSGTVPFDVEGTWIEFLDANGNVASSYEITTRSSTTVTLSAAPNTTIGAAYRGMFRVDKVTSRGEAIAESTGLTTNTFVGGTSGIFRLTTADGISDVTMLNATAEVNGTLFAPNLTMTGSVLTHTKTTATTINRLGVNVTGTLTVDAASTIDVSTRGLTGSVNGTAYTYDRGTDKPTLTGGATSFSAGSHGGQGGLWTGNVPAAFGSPFDPNEPGGAGAGGAGTNCTPCRSGGGVARIKAGTLRLAGKILANGESVDSAAAGGSIRIDAASIAGAGEIHADG